MLQFTLINFIHHAVDKYNETTLLTDCRMYNKLSIVLHRHVEPRNTGGLADAH